MIPSTQPSPIDTDGLVPLAVRIFTAISEAAAIAKPLTSAVDLLGVLEGDQPADILIRCRTALRAMEGAEFITHTPTAIKPTALGLAIAGKGDIEKQLADHQVLGWRYMLASCELALQEQILNCERKDDEIRAYKERVALERELAGEVTACEAEVEAAKAETSAAKERLAAANTKLAAFVRGEVQTSLANGEQQTIGEVTAYEQGMKAFDPAKAEAVNPYPEDPQAGDWRRGYDQAKEKHQRENPPVFVGAEKAPVKTVAELGKVGFDYRETALDDALKEELRRGTAIQVKDRITHLYERQYLVAEFTADRALCIPLYTKDEWSDLHETKFGRPVEGVDQTDEAKIHRQQGGEFCGRAVKVDRKKFIVGPVFDALIVDAKATAESAPAA